MCAGASISVSSRFSTNSSNHSGRSRKRSFEFCVRSEGVQSALTLFCSGAAQVCHDDRVELKEQLEVEEEDGDKQDEEIEVENGEASQRDAPMNMTVDDNVNALRT